MKRILFGLVLVAGAAGVIVSGATGAFFSDTETSTGNTFAAGAIDLKIDNESYYNSNVCAVDVTDADDDQNVTEYLWQGTALYPVPGTACDTSFPLSDLGNGLLFFNFTDLKPDDEGEDTISIHVQNDAHMCLDMALTSDDDNSSTEPELDAPDVTEDLNDTWDGELADTIDMFWWADDGDNVYESGENQITDGVQDITTMFGPDHTFSVALADSQNNAWGLVGPVPANETVYIAKAWCMGTMTLSPEAQDGLGEESPRTPATNTGVLCDGTALGNDTQTDGLTMDIAFRAEQARNNPNFLCNDEETRTATLTVIKQVTNNNGGNNIVADFQLFADNGVTETGVTSGVPTPITVGTYTITETGISGYVASFSGDCDASGQITLAPGDNKTCTITNDDLPGNITLIKSVVNNNGGTATANSAWGLRVDGSIVPNNTSVAVTANTPHTINEDGRTGYHFVSITGNALCPAVLGGTATLAEGEAITCTITNDDN